MNFRKKCPSMLLLILLEQSLLAAAQGICCTAYNGSLCYSEASPEVCNVTNCETQCGAEFTYNMTKVISAETGLYYGTPVLVAYVRAPLYMIRPIAANIGRSLLMSRHEVGILRATPVVGVFAALFTPEYDADNGAVALGAVRELGLLASRMAATQQTLISVTRANEKARLAAEWALAQGIYANSAAINEMRSALDAGITMAIKRTEQALIGAETARAEAALLVFLAKQERIPQDISVNPIAQKMLKLAMFCYDVPELCLDMSEDSVEFYVTSWLYAWGKNPSDNTTSMGSLFSRVKVFRRPSALSFLAPGDTYFYRYEIEPVMIGSGGSPELTYCSGTVQECSVSFMAECRSSPGCYYHAQPAYFNASAYGGIQASPCSSPFRSAPISPQDCGGYNTLPECCGPRHGTTDPSICIHTCNDTSTGIGRYCDPKLDVLGARPTTIWTGLPLDIPFVRSMESMGHVPKPMCSCIVAGMMRTNVCTGRTDLIPHAADFFNPFAVGLALFDERNLTMSDRMREMLESANYQDNTGLAIPGPMVTYAVGQVIGTNAHVIMNSTHIQSSVAILNYATGGAMYIGWVPQDGCSLDDNGIHCNAILPGPLVSSMPYIQQEIENLTPQEYRARTLYDNYINVTGVLDRLLSGLSNITFRNITEMVAEINSKVNTSDTILGAAAADLAVVQASLATQQERIAELQRRSAQSEVGSWSASTIALAVIGSIFLLIFLSCAVYVFVVMIRQGGTSPAMRV